MSGRGDDSDSDAPEEFTSLQGIEQDEEIRKVEKENKARYYAPLSYLFFLLFNIPCFSSSANQNPVLIFEMLRFLYKFQPTLLVNSFPG